VDFVGSIALDDDEVGFGLNAYYIDKMTSMLPNDDR
jgi:hypothetical protein